MNDLDRIRLAYATPSLGMNPNHTLEQKLHAAAKAGFQGVELGFDDLCAYSKRHVRAFKGEQDVPTLLKSAQETRQLCAELNLEIICLQPFTDFEGLIAPMERRDRMERAERWFKVMHELGTTMLQVGSTDNPYTYGDVDLLAFNLSALCDAAAAKEPQIRIAYEPWCWGVHTNTWEAGWDMVRRVNRPNFGLNLDTFHVAGREWADPASPTGLVEGYEERELTARFEASMELLARTVPADKIFYLQISDALKMDPPIVEGGHEAYNPRKPARAEWSRAFRPLPFENGYLPVVTALRGFLATGFRGWVSMENFEERQMGEDEGIPDEYAQRGMECWKKLVAELEKE
jgi:sugar phosphate isomerase/epimerase